MIQPSLEKGYLGKVPGLSNSINELSIRLGHKEEIRIHSRSQVTPNVDGLFCKILSSSFLSHLSLFFFIEYLI